MNGRPRRMLIVRADLAGPFESTVASPTPPQPLRMSGILRQRARVCGTVDRGKNVFDCGAAFPSPLGRSFGKFAEDCVDKRCRRSLSCRFDKFHTFEDRSARRDSRKKLQLIYPETQRRENLVVTALQ